MTVPGGTSRGFIASYTVAQIGAHVAFIPLLQIVVPVKAGVIAGQGAAGLLSVVVVAGALSASVANIVAGTLSDRTPVRLGRRRAWLVGGLAAVLLSYVLVGRAESRLALVGAVVAFQIAFNAMFAPLMALFADRVADGQRGFVSACLGLAYPVGSLLGAVSVGALLTGEAARLTVTGLIVTALVLPFALLVREPAMLAPARADTQAAVAMRDFAAALLGRLCVITALTLVQIYLLLFLRALSQHSDLLPGTPERGLAALAAVTTGSNVVCAILIGWASDRIGRRKHLVVAGAIVLALGICGMALSTNWPALVAATLLFGAGSGVYYAVDLALLAQVLPSRAQAGRSFGFINLANTLPQVVAPLIGLGVLQGLNPDFSALFGVAAGAALLGGLLTMLVRSVR